MKYIYLLLVVLVSTTCNSNKKSTDITEVHKDIDSVFVTYFCGKFDSNIAIKCEKIATIQAIHPKNNYSSFVEVVDTFIADKTILEKIKLLLDKKEILRDYNEDARMYVTIKYKDNTIDNICLGMNTPHVLFNGTPTMIENKLVYLLRQYSGYYKWFNNEDYSKFIEINQKE